MIEAIRDQWLIATGVAAVIIALIVIWLAPRR